MGKISIIVPTLNEEENIRPLVKEISDVLNNDYEIIFIDDHSTDKTVLEINKLKKNYPIRVFLKKGARGKTHSLVEGFKKAKYEYLGMIDADLQYPPSYLPSMIALLDKNLADVVVTSRREYNAPFFRKLTSVITSSIITVLFGLNFDTQSGLKVFTRKVYKSVPITTENEWTFDIDFLAKAQKKNYRIESIDIKFNKRMKGASKTIGFPGTKRGILKEAVLLKIRKD